MAKIWPVYEGKEPTSGGPWAHLPLLEAIELLELTPDSFRSDLTMTPRFGDTERDLWYAGYKHIVVEVEPGEIRKTKDKKWRPGFYKSSLTPKEAFRRLVERDFATELGKDNVIRVELETSTDSLGRNALTIKVVIPPGADQRLAKNAALDALVRLQSRLREWGQDRTPIIEYATEAELEQQDDDHQS